MTQITDFIVEGLHGYKNFSIKFKDNRLILVGENGSGKTSVLRIFYYFLTCNWAELIKFKFKKVTLKINNSSYEISHADIEQNNYANNKLLRHLPPSLRENIKIALNKGDFEYIDLILSRYLSPMKYREFRNNFFHYQINIFDNLENNIKECAQKINKLVDKLEKNIDFNILYLPTYRRIERELEFILKGYDKDDFKNISIRSNVNNQHSSKNHVELIQFGMNDVNNAKDEILYKLKEFQRTELNLLTLKYLGDVVNKKYERINIAKIKKAIDDDIDNVLGRIDENLLNEETKNKLRETIKTVKSSKGSIYEDEHARVICHYFSKLLDFQEKLKEKEVKMRDFCRVCNKYITDKEFCYESSSFEFSIRSKFNNDNIIQFQQLSSGEKQIVSLFSQLYLSDSDNYFVIIDEPEMSLSVPWQREFLVDIHKGAFCKGLFAVTHSPFIYDNELEKYTHGLGEFNR